MLNAIILNKSYPPRAVKRFKTEIKLKPLIYSSRSHEQLQMLGMGFEDFMAVSIKMAVTYNVITTA